MTNNDISDITIVMNTKEGEHLIATSTNQVLIAFICDLCEFRKLKDEVVNECLLSEITV